MGSGGKRVITCGRPVWAWVPAARSASTMARKKLDECVDECVAVGAGLGAGAAVLFLSVLMEGANVDRIAAFYRIEEGRWALLLVS